MKPRVIVFVSLLVGSLIGLAAWRLAIDDDPRPEPPGLDDVGPVAALPGQEEDPTGTTSASGVTTGTVPVRAGYVITRDHTALAAHPDQAGSPVAGGIAMPITEDLGDRYRVLDTCNKDGWLAVDDVEVGRVPQAQARVGFGASVFVIDPGHGLPDLGATGPNGLTETEVNLDVSARLADLLVSPRDIDWASGEVTSGTQFPAAADTILTRGPDGPNGGDYQLGLRFRAELANAVEATALISIHHNAGPETTLDHPGSEAFVSVGNTDSPRLGGLMVEELRASFARFSADWAGSTGNGVTTRVDADGTDYYTLLEVAEVPAAIVEGAYISNPSEEALAATEEFRQAYAEAVYRALVRFVTTDDDPIPAPEPVLWEVDRPGPSTASCTVPAPAEG